MSNECRKCGEELNRSGILYCDPCAENIKLQAELETANTVIDMRDVYIEALRAEIARLTKELDEAQSCVILENKQLKERERQLVGVLQHIEVKCVDYDGYKNAVGLMKLIDTIKQIAETEESLSA